MQLQVRHFQRPVHCLTSCSIQLFISAQLATGLEREGLLIVIRQMLMFVINLHLCGLNECRLKRTEIDVSMLCCCISLLSLLVMKISLYFALDTMNPSRLVRQYKLLYTLMAKAMGKGAD